MKLYELKSGQTFLLQEQPTTPPDSEEVDYDAYYKYIKLDGMYCWCKDEEGLNHYFAAWTDVSVCPTVQEDIPV